MVRRHRYKGKTCAYCAAEGTSEASDHIFARAFFPVEERANLPMVPACRACNQAKAALESYVLAVLPFGGENPSGSRMLNEAVPRRLNANRKLHRELAQGQSSRWIDRGGLMLPTLSIPFDATRLYDLFSFITRGLVAFHWNVVIPVGHASRAGMFTRHGEPIMEQLFRHRSAAHVRGRLGNETILYEGAQGIDDPCLTIWRYRIYGGTLLVDDSGAQPEGASTIWATTSTANAPSFFDPDDLAQSDGLVLS